MGHHYLHVNPDVKLHLGNQLPGDGWIELIVSDLTENGTQLSAIVLPTNEFGPQIALYGDQFFARASTDKFRPDTLWVYRVESGRNPNQVPVKIAGRFEPLIAGRSSPPRDPVAPLFGTPADVTSDTEPERVLRLKPNARLTKILASMPATVRAAWRPSVDVPVPPSAPDFLRTLRSLWARYKLARFTSPTAREEWLLRGQLTTEKLPNEERLALAALVDVGTLNALAGTSDATREFLGDFLRRLAELVPPSDVRAAVWGAMLAGASDVEVRDEIRSSAAGLRALVENRIAERAWTRATLDGLAAAATRNTDAAITELLQKVEGDTHPLLGIASWADRLESVSSNDAIESPAPTEAAAPTVVVQAVHLASAPPINGESAPGPITAITPEGDAAARWALEKCVGDLKPFATSLESLRTAAAVFDHATSLDTPDSIVGVINHLETLAAETRHCLEQLPSKSQLEVDLSEAARVHAAARTALGEEFDPSQAPFDTLNVPELAELVALVERDSQLVALPPWAWHSKNSVDSTPVDCPTRSERLCDPAVRRLVSQIVTLIGDFGDVSASAIVKISPPPIHVAPDEHMRLELEQLRLAAQRLQRIPQEHREWMQLALARGDDEEETLQLLERFQALGMRLPSETAKTLREDVLCIENPASRENRLHQYEQAVKFFEESLGTAQDVTAGQLNKRLERMYQTEAPALPAAHDLTVDHNWVGTTKTRAPLVFVAHEDPTRPYGFVSVPVAFESHRRWEYHLRVDVRVRTKQRGQSWLQEWDKHTPETLDIGVQDWRRSAEGRFVYTFELRIAIRRPERNNEAFEFSLQVTDLISGRAIAPEKSLRWESIEVGFEPLAFDWPGGIRPDYVKAHPVGPQKRLDRIEARLRGGTGFAVVAPRRFGKTTLVEYLRERATSLHLVCPEPIVCTSFTDDRGLVDLSSIWRTVAENLQSSLQCTVAADLKNDLPSPHAFDRARRAAAHAGSKGILLLFDESQLMFSPATGARIGDRLKDLLERNWMGKPTTDSVPILLGFVGLPSFSNNVG